MKALKLRVIFALLALLSTLSFPLGANAGAKRRIAILPFEYGAVTAQVGTYDVGKGITSLLITKLVNDGTYSVMERQILDKILKEQNLSVSDRADQSTALKIGKLLSVDAIIIGTVTQFGFETKSTNLGGIGTGYIPGIPYVGSVGGLLGGVGTRKSKAKVAIDARLVDCNTGEILAACHGSGESKRSSTSLLGGLGGLDMTSSDFAQTVAGEATLQAVEAIGGQLESFAAKIPDNQSAMAADVKGKVADVTGNQVTVNLGKANGIASGDNLQIERVVKTIKDPDSGKVIKEVTNIVAVVTLNQVDDTSASGNIVKGNDVRLGDQVRKLSTDITSIVISSPSTAAAVVPSNRSMSVTGKTLSSGKKTK